MTCSSTFLKYPLAVLVQTPATYILTYCNGCSTAFNFLLHIASNSGKRYWDCSKATLYQSSDRTVQHLCLHLLYADQSFAGSKKAKEIMTGHQRETRNQLLLLFRKVISLFCHFCHIAILCVKHALSGRAG